MCHIEIVFSSRASSRCWSPSCPASLKGMAAVLGSQQMRLELGKRVVFFEAGTAMCLDKEMPHWVHFAVDLEKVCSTTSLAAELAFTLHACMNFLWWTLFSMRRIILKPACFMQNFQHLTVKLCHNMSVVFLSCVMISCSSDQSLPVVGMMSHDVLPSPQILLRTGKG